MQNMGSVGIPCPHVIKAAEHKIRISKKEIIGTIVKRQPWQFTNTNYNLMHAIEPPELVKLVGKPKRMREREKNEVVKRQGVWKLTRKGKVMTCSNCENKITMQKDVKRQSRGNNLLRSKGNNLLTKGKILAGEKRDSLGEV